MSSVHRFDPDLAQYGIVEVGTLILYTSQVIVDTDTNVGICIVIVPKEHPSVLCSTIGSLLVGTI
jgi:hypothetical protein